VDQLFGGGQVTGQAPPDSLKAAIKMAAALAKRRFAEGEISSSS